MELLISPKVVAAIKFQSFVFEYFFSLSLKHDSIWRTTSEVLANFFLNFSKFRIHVSECGNDFNCLHHKVKAFQCVCYLCRRLSSDDDLLPCSLRNLHCCRSFLHLHLRNRENLQKVSASRPSPDRFERSKPSPQTSWKSPKWILKRIFYRNLIVNAETFSSSNSRSQHYWQDWAQSSVFSTFSPALLERSANDLSFSHAAK